MHIGYAMFHMCTFLTYLMTLGLEEYIGTFIYFSFLPLEKLIKGIQMILYCTLAQGYSQGRYEVRAAHEVQHFGSSLLMGVAPMLLFKNHWQEAHCPPVVCKRRTSLSVTITPMLE